MTEKKRRLRVLIAKTGLDGHDKAAKILALYLRNAGYEVLYTGLRRTIDEIVKTAIEEDVDVIGLSFYSGVHLPASQELMQKLKEANAEDIVVVVGGVIPKKDVKKLKEMGVAEVFPVGTRIDEVLDFFKKLEEEICHDQKGNN
ncbi:cobalamin-dependent protein [Ferroglobus sp.]|uniref:cobalamin B12-binding domain-containing protein n=1 Tax=Ferroglobus sp. TaxID=2614230 RepID=UPI0025BFB606|nr:cobalamin-dependent protein [Ferroglobus sp.]